MHGWSRGIVVIKDKKSHGLLHRKTEYKGYLKNASNLSGYSINQKFMKTYRIGEKVETRYRMLTYEHGPEQGEEYIEFEILE